MCICVFCDAGNVYDDDTYDGDYTEHAFFLGGGKADHAAVPVCVYDQQAVQHGSYSQQHVVTRRFLQSMQSCLPQRIVVHTGSLRGRAVISSKMCINAG